VPVAAQIAGKQHLWVELDAQGMAEVKSKLIQRG
jgi:ATP-dependent Lhr-like helicase